MKTIADLISPADILSTKLPPSTPILGVTNHSKDVKPGSLFFALAGSTRDSHDLIPEALSLGASAVIVENLEAFDRFTQTCLVTSTRHVMGPVASRFYGKPTSKLKLVGVTGTNGKTTSTYLLRSLWEAEGITSGVLGTVEYYIGNKIEKSTLTTPDPIVLQSLFARMVEAKATHAAIEVSSIALDQERVGGCQFQVALFTNLTQDHLDYHKTFENYYLAKLRLFRDYGLNAAVINGDDVWGQRLLKDSTAKRNVSFSLSNPSADFYADDFRFQKDATLANVRTPDGKFVLRSPLIGKHNLYNCLGVLGVAYALGQDLPTAIQALETAVGAPGRLERVATPAPGPHVFVDYAHSDDALRNVLSALRDLRGVAPGRIITVFGCGGDRDRTKRPRMAEVVSSLSDITIATSDNPRTEDPEAIVDEVERGILRDVTDYRREVDRKTAIHLALSLASAEDIVLVAGKGHETYQIIGTETFPFDDREVVRQFFKS